MPRIMVVFIFCFFKIFTLMVYFFRSPYGDLFEPFSSPLTYQYDVTLDDDSTNGYDSQRGFPVFAESAVNSSAEEKVILLTYMRSGSSFTGDLFNHHPDVFYVYEPLYPVKWYFSRGEPASFLHREPLAQNELALQALQSHVVSSYLNCSMGALYLRALTYFGLHFGQKTQTFHRCLQVRPGSALPHSDTIQGCLPLLQSPCVTSKVILLKVVRFSMDLVENFLRNDPKVKVVHLVRDPRATLRSQRAKGMFKTKDTTKIAYRFCRKVSHDLRRADMLRTKFPGRVILTRYEDLAEEPMRMSETLFKFVGLRTGNRKLLQYVWNLTSAGLPDNSLSFTQRRNSKETAQLWREKLDFGSSRVIDDHCEDVYKQLGYLPFLTEGDLKNVSVPAYVRVRDFVVV